MIRLSFIREDAEGCDDRLLRLIVKAFGKNRLFQIGFTRDHEWDGKDTYTTTRWRPLVEAWSWKELAR